MFSFHEECRATLCSNKGHFPLKGKVAAWVLFQNGSLQGLAGGTCRRIDVVTDSFNISAHTANCMARNAA